MTYPVIEAPIEQVYTRSDGKTGYRWSAGRKAAPSLIVLHYDATFSAYATWKVLKERGLSVHFTVDRDGTRLRHVADANRCYHAGSASSSWLGLADPNDISLGAEITNIGWLTGVYNKDKVKEPAYRWSDKAHPEHAPDFDGFEYYRLESWTDPKGVVKKTAIVTRQPGSKFPDHRQATREYLWAKYSAAQVESIVEMVMDWVNQYGILPENIVGHEHLDPSRKLDPGPAFRAVWDAIEKAYPQQVKDKKLIDPNHLTALRVKALQSHLRRLGVYSGSIDGDWGPRTQSALEDAFALFFDDYDFPWVDLEVRNVTELCGALRRVPGFNPAFMDTDERGRLRTNVSRIQHLLDND